MLINQKLLFFFFLLLATTTERCSTKAAMGNHFPLFQKNYWYEYSTPPSTVYPEYIDYHLSSESSITQTKTYPQILSRFDMKEDHPLNVTAQIASTITLHCVIRNLNNKTVSWLKRLSPEHVPDLLTFGETIYVKDARISIKRQLQENNKEKTDEDWMLQILHSKIPDSGLYMCQVSTEPPQIHKIYLSVEAPVLTVMDGFGRKLLDQFYKVGSSLEVMCHVDRLPKRPLPEIIEWRHGDKILSKSNATLGQSVRTELDGAGALSRLSITQANVRHSGIYTCSVSDTISQSLRLHIIDESKPVPIINNGSTSTYVSPNDASLKIGFAIFVLIILDYLVDGGLNKSRKFG